MAFQLPSLLVLEGRLLVKWGTNQAMGEPPDSGPRSHPTRGSRRLLNGYQSVLVVVIVVMMANDDHMVVVAVVAAVMPIWLRKSAGGKEHEQDKCQILLHVRTVTNAHNNCLCNNALIPDLTLKLTAQGEQN
jgi:hypothetical protein